MRTLRYVVIALAGLIGLVVLLLAGVLLVSDVSGVRATLRPRLETLLSEALRLQVRIGELSALSLWRGVRAQDVTLSAEGEPLIAARALWIRPDLVTVLPPRLGLRVEGEGLAVDMRRRDDGTFDLVQAFASDEPEPAEEAPPPEWLDAIDVVLRDGLVRVAGVAEQPLVLSAVDAHAVLVLGTPGRLTIDTLETSFGSASRLAARGWLDLGAPSALEVSLEVRPLAGVDLQPLAPQVAAAARLTGTVQVVGTLDEPRVEAHLAAGAGSVDLWGALAHTATGDRLDASWQLVGIDPATLIEGGPPAAVSGAGSVQAVLGEGVPRELQADARFWSSRVGDVAADWITAQARREGERVLVDVQLAAPNQAASASLAAWVGVDEPHAAAGELRFELLRPADLPAPVPETLADSELRGRLTASASALLGDERALQAELQLERGRLRGVPLDRALARARLDGGIASLDELRVEGGATKLLAWGWTQIDGPPEQRQLRAGVVGPIDLALVPDARGVVRADVSAWGTTSAIDAHATLRSNGDVQLPAVRGTLTVDASARGVGGDSPSARVALDARLVPRDDLAVTLGPEPRTLDLDLAWRRPRPGEPTLAAAATLQGAAPDQVEVELTATEPDGRKHRVVGLVERAGETISARLDELRFTPPEGVTWSLLQTATVSYGPNRIAARDLELGSRAGRIEVDGELVRDGRNDLALSIVDLDLKEVCTLAGLRQDCAGELDAALRLAGTTAKPNVAGDVRVRGLALAGQDYGGADLTLATEERLVVAGSLGQAPLGPLELAARVPLVGGWPAPTVATDRPIDATVRGDDIQLAGFRAFAEDAVTELGGQANIEVELAGTLQKPRLSGGIDASDIRLTLAATNATWRDGRLRMSFVDDAITLDELSLRDTQDGSVSGHGSVLLGGGNPSFDLTIELRSLEVAARPDVVADASGDVRIDGSVAQPRIAGQISIDSATIRPALLPGGSGPPPDTTIHVIHAHPPDEAQPKTIGEALERAAEEAREADEDVDEEEDEKEPALFDRVTMNVTVTLVGPVVVQRTDAYLRLEGQVYVTKAPDDPLRVSGQIYSMRGWYLFRGRRIVLQEAYLTFSGETPINPYLTVRASYQTPEYTVRIGIEGTATTPELELSSEPPLDQSDILSVLLFGKTTQQLTSGQGTELRQEALGLLASYVAPELEQSLMDTFGLASLTFQLPTGSSYGSVGVGRYFGDDIFVSIGQTFGGPQGGTTRQLSGLVGSSLTVQYYLTPSITVQTSSSTEGESALDVIWHRRY
ncbi:MAG TPA: translocation/assembly module TamB domain-containing protein [Candidatus Binatia bacterium]